MPVELHGIQRLRVRVPPRRESRSSTGRALEGRKAGCFTNPCRRGRLISDPAAPAGGRAGDRERNRSGDEPGWNRVANADGTTGLQIPISRVRIPPGPAMRIDGSVAKWSKAWNVSSILVAARFSGRTVAQLAAHRIFNPRGVGSNPTGPMDRRNVDLTGLCECRRDYMFVQRGVSPRGFGRGGWF